MKGSSGDWKDGLKLLKIACPCQAHSVQHTEVNLPPVPGFTDCPENGLYDCAALARWFWKRAEEIGARFDRRNGSPNYQRQLCAARKD